MINLNQIKEKAFYDELKKIASEGKILNQVITGLTAGASSGTAAALINKSINKKNNQDVKK
jgi:predicted DNA-binding ribbon-helix-helix protein